METDTAGGLERQIAPQPADDLEAQVLAQVIACTRPLQRDRPRMKRLLAHLTDRFLNQPEVDRCSTGQRDPGW